MADYGEDFIRCKCGSVTFEEKTVMMIKKNPKRLISDDKSSEIYFLDALEKKIKYVCTKCGKEIDF